MSTEHDSASADPAQPPELNNKSLIAKAKEATRAEQTAFRTSQAEFFKLKRQIEEEFHIRGMGSSWLSRYIQRKPHPTYTADTLYSKIDESLLLDTQQKKEDAFKIIDHATHDYTILYNALVASITETIATPQLAYNNHHLAQDAGSKLVRSIIDDLTQEIWAQQSRKGGRS